jgi:hypothetical protein
MLWWASSTAFFELPLLYAGRSQLEFAVSAVAEDCNSCEVKALLPVVFVVSASPDGLGFETLKLGI